MNRILSLMVISVVSTFCYGEDFFAEGFSSTKLVSDSLAKRYLASIRRRNPNATLEDAKIMVAKRSAMMDAMRNQAEYLNGITFEYENNTFTKKKALVTRSKGMFRFQRPNYQVLKSGTVIARIKIQQKNTAIAKARKNLKIYKVIGVCKKKQKNIFMAMRQAKMNAVQQAIVRAIKNENPARFKGKTLGRVYIVKTIDDRLEPYYKIKMHVQVHFD